MAPNPKFNKLQKERKRQERQQAKRQQRQERGRAGTAGSGPPIDYDARQSLIEEQSEGTDDEPTLPSPGPGRP